MASATDGDVDRALAAMGAAVPLKYHSFGVITVRPPGTPASPPGSPGPTGVAPSGFAGDPAQPAFQPQPASAVFSLLGKALPEAFQIDVEPQWPGRAPAATTPAVPPADIAPAAQAPSFASPSPQPFSPQPPPPGSHPGSYQGAGGFGSQSFPAAQSFPAYDPRAQGNPPHSPGAPAPSRPDPEPTPYSPFTLPPWLEPPTRTAAPPAPPASAPPAAPPHDPFQMAPPHPLSPADQYRAQTGSAALPSWLEPAPPPAHAPPPPASTPPALSGPAGFTPFADPDPTLRNPAPSFPPWLDQVPSATRSPGFASLESPQQSFASPVAPGAPPPAPPPADPIAMFPPPADPAVRHEPPLISSGAMSAGGGWLSPETQSPPPVAASFPSWTERPWSEEPAAPQPPMFQEPSVHQEPPMFREPPPVAAPLPPPAEAPARKPLAALFRSLGAAPARRDDGGSDRGAGL